MNYSPKQYKDEFLTSELGAEIKAQLLAMESDEGYITRTTYSSASGSDISFAEKHFTDLCTHQTSKPREYIANLRLMTKVRNYRS